MKRCSKCKIDKNFSFFNKNKGKRSKDGYSNQCKQCAHEYYVQNKERIAEYSANYFKKKYSVNKDKFLNRNKEYMVNNKPKIRARSLKNKERIKYTGKKWAEKNKERIKQVRQLYEQNNKEKRNKRVRERIKSNPKTKMAALLRSSIYLILKNRFGNPKSKKTLELLGCDFDFFKAFIERQFKRGMRWENHGRYGWHIDHKIPIASAKTDNELILLFHYTNLQPMWWRENIIKSDKILPTQMTLTI